MGPRSFIAKKLAERRAKKNEEDTKKALEHQQPILTYAFLMPFPEEDAICVDQAMINDLEGFEEEAVEIDEELLKEFEAKMNEQEEELSPEEVERQLEMLIQQSEESVVDQDVLNNIAEYENNIELLKNKLVCIKNDKYITHEMRRDALERTSRKLTEMTTLLIQEMTKSLTFCTF